jgi:hypothetical protein
LDNDDDERVEDHAEQFIVEEWPSGTTRKECYLRGTLSVGGTETKR